jgi:hypothetical protein
MNKTRRTTTAVLASVAMMNFFSGAAAQAEGILDQQLGPAASASPKPADQNASKAAVTPAPVSPSAAKTVDDNDLIKQLTTPGAQAKDTGANPTQELKDVLDRMVDSQTRLTDKDPGAVTQESQRRIVTDLDTVIEYVRKQQQQSQSNPKSNSRPADKRQQSQGQKQGNQQQPGNHAAQDSRLTTGNVEAPQSNGESLRQKGPAEWGNLPPKDRDLISNGVNEQYLPAYKDMIDRYYQALAEVGKTREKP